MSPLLPTALWAQRKDKVFLTIDIQDVKEHSLKLDNDAGGGHGTLSFSGRAGTEGAEYSLPLTFFKPIDVEASKVSVTPRAIFLVIAKKEAGEEHWPRLTKEPSKAMAHIKVDWDKWVDEDEEDAAQARRRRCRWGGWGSAARAAADASGRMRVCPIHCRSPPAPQPAIASLLCILQTLNTSPNPLPNPQPLKQPS